MEIQHIILEILVSGLNGYVWNKQLFLIYYLINLDYVDTFCIYVRKSNFLSDNKLSLF